jgi:uncharacterized membrane protein
VTGGQPGAGLLRLTMIIVLVSLGLHWAVRLLAADWPWLLAIAAVVLGVRLYVAWLRWRRSGW